MAVNFLVGQKCCGLVFVQVPPIGCQADKILIFSFLEGALAGRLFGIDTDGVRWVGMKKPHKNLSFYGAL